MTLNTTNTNTTNTNTNTTNTNTTNTMLYSNTKLQIPPLFKLETPPLRFKSYTNINKLYNSSTCNVSVEYLVLQRKKKKYSKIWV